MKKKLIIILKILSSAAMLFFLFYKVPLTEILSALSDARIELIIPAYILYLSYIFLSAYETGYLTRVQGIFISTFLILKIHLASMFYNLFLPGLISGGAIKWYKFSKFGSKSNAAAVIAFNRLLETLMLIFTGIVFSLPVIFASDSQPLIIVVFLLLFFVMGVYFLFLNQKSLVFFEKIILKIPLPELIKNGIRKIFDSMHKFRNLTPRQNIEIFSLLFFYHTATMVAGYLLTIALGIDISFYDLAWIRTVVSIFMLLPISFAGLGVREGSLIFFLGKYGVKSDLAMAYSLLLFLNLIITSLIGGLIEFISFISGKKTIAETKAEG